MRSKKPMKIKLRATATVAFSCFITLITANTSLADTSCSATSWFDAHKDSNAANGEDGYCYITPQAMNVRLYEFGLCTSAASPSNREQCTTLVANSAGLALELSTGVSLPLAAGVSIPEGVYSHAFVVLSNVTSLETVIEFSSARTDDRGSTGSYCYTDGRSIDNSPSIISCGNDPTAVTASTEVIGLDAGGYTNTELNYTVTMRGENVVTDLYSITSAGQLSTNYGDDFALFGSQILNQPISVTPNTTNIDIGFSITDGVTIGFAPGGGATDAPVDAAFEGLRFVISAQ
jgi:hypothetical protein